jgi:hypothetical protein
LYPLDGTAEDVIGNNDASPQGDRLGALTATGVKDLYTSGR